MIIEHKHLDLNDQAIFERLRFRLPLKAKGNMQHEACFFLSCNAEGKLYTPNEGEEVIADEAMLMRCGNYMRHLDRSAKGKDISDVFLVHFYPGLFELIYKDEFPEFLTSKTTTLPKKYVHKIPLNDLLEAYVKSLWFYFDHPDLVTEDLLILKLKELIMLLVNADYTGNVKSFLSAFFSPMEYDFRKTVEAYVFEPLALEDLAFLCNLSLSSFQRRFREIYNDSPAHYFKSKRLQKAAELLRTRKLSVSDICYQCGFSAPNYFTKAFKAQFGLTPREYRKS